MIAVLTLSLKVVFSLLSLFGSVRGFLQLKNFNFTKFNQFLFFESLIVYSFCQFYALPMIEKCSLAFVQGTFVSFIVVLLVNEMTVKKNKVLWRVPLIFALVAYNFSVMQVEMAFVISEFLLLALAFSKRASLNYVYRQQFKSTLASLICLLSFLWDDIFFLLGLILIINMKFQIINALKLKLKMSELND